MKPAANCLELTTDIISAYVGNNVTAADMLPGLIESIYRSLATQSGSVDADKTTDKQKPAVAVNRSVFPDCLVCLEDGRRLKILKRHLQNVHGLTPEAYRKRWRLSRSYPMVAPDYASRRSAMAKEMGLGRKKVAGYRKKQ